MAEIGLAASVIAVLQLTGACLKLSSKWIGPSEFGSSDLTSMTKALYDFNGAMKNIQTNLEIYEDNQVRLSSLECLAPALGRCRDALDVIEDFMEQTSFIGKHFSGPRFDRKLKASLKALDGAKELFTLALHADQQMILNGVERYIRNVAEDLRDLRENVTAGLKRLHDVADTAHKEATKARRQQEEWQVAAGKATSAMQAVLYRQDARENVKERSAIIDWLTAIDYSSQQVDFINKRQTGTGQWLLESAEFKGWTELGKQTIFCPGIPGAGKTILTSIVVEHLHTRFRNDPSVGIAYLYCNFRRQHEQTAEDLLASLFRQLALGRLSLPDNVNSLYEKHKDNHTRPSFDEISRNLQSVAALYSRVFIIVDALDECQTYSGCRARFVRECFALQANCGTNFFATSRFIPEITANFEGSVSLEIRALEQDVRRYVDGHLSHLPSFVRSSPDLQEEIKTGIVGAVDGMFLLAQLHLHSLIGKRSPKAIRAALKRLPTGSEAYNYAYEEAMNRIEGQVTDQVELAKQVLSWITCAKRPLTTSELQHALAVEVGEAKLDEDNLPQIEDMVSVCAGLVTVDRETSVIRLVHYTTQEYFERTKRQWFPDAESNITITCVTYLSFDVFGSGFCRTDDEFEERLRSNQLYNYAANHWGYHARETEVLSSVVFDFLKSEAKVEASSQVLMAVKMFSGHSKYSQLFTRQMTGLHLVAYLGVHAAANDLISSGHRPDPKDSDGRTPLTWAAEKGHEEVVRLLLATGKVDLDSKDSNGRTSLSWAAANGYEEVVRLLLATGKVDIDSNNKWTRTPLNWAAAGGHKEVVRLLLATGKVDINLNDDDGYTPLSWAAAKGHEEVVRLLLATAKVDINLNDDWASRPFSCAAAGGHKEVVRLLLATGKVDINAKDTTSSTPLSYAAAEGHEEVVRLLLATGEVDIDSNDDWASRPFSWARRPFSRASSPSSWDSSPSSWDSTPSSRASSPSSWTAAIGREEVVRLLLAMGNVDINSNDDRASRPLSWAALELRDAIEQLLPKNGARVDSREMRGQTPLSRAAEYGYEGLLELLLATGNTDVDLENICGRTPLSWAASEGHSAIVQLLLKNGARVNSRDGSRRTPLSRAAEHGHEGVVTLLLATGNIDVDLNDICGRTPLSWAASKGHGAIVQLLLKNGAKHGHEGVVKLLLSTEKVVPDSHDCVWRTPLSLAAENAHERVVKLFLATGTIEQDPRDFGEYGGRTPLSYAAGNGHEALVELLLGTSTIKPGSRHFGAYGGRTPLSYAAGNGHKAVVELLLDTARVDPDSTDGSGRTPLSYAAEHGHVAVMAVLLAQDRVNPDNKDIDGRTPLSWAASWPNKTWISASEDTERMKLLLGNNMVDPDSKDNSGRTPLSWAAEKGPLAVVKLLLLTDKVGVDSEDHHGRTPLWHATEKARDDVVELLLKRREQLTYHERPKNG